LSDDELGFRDERTATLGELVTGVGDRVGYSYDFGDGWEHDLAVEQVGVTEPDTRYPVCVAGTGDCPPEDCGGVFGYEQLREILADPSHPEHESMREWLGLAAAAEFDAARFDIDAANQALAGIDAQTAGSR
jgi:Plasmid pRiA4b ORF-3-like protein.